MAVFQPHGFGPARFLRPELRELLPRLLRPQYSFCYAEIFYAGGTVARDVSSSMLADDLPPAIACGHAPDHVSVVAWVTATARPGDADHGCARSRASRVGSLYSRRPRVAQGPSRRARYATGSLAADPLTSDQPGSGTKIDTRGSGPISRVT